MPCSLMKKQSSWMRTIKNDNRPATHGARSPDCGYRLSVTHDYPWAARINYFSAKGDQR